MCQGGKLVLRSWRCWPDPEMLSVERSAKVRMQVNKIQELVEGESDQFFPKGCSVGKFLELGAGAGF